MKFITNIRKHLGWTQYRLARELNLPVNSISHLEANGQKIAPADLCRIKQLTGLTWPAFGKLLEKEFLE